MFQSCWVRVINVLTKKWTEKRSCLIVEGQWVQFGLGQLDTNEDEVRWVDALGWQNLETLNVCYQTCLGRLICGSFSHGCVVETHPKEVEVYKWIINSWNVWFSCSRLLKTTKTSSMDVNMISKQKIAIKKEQK